MALTTTEEAQVRQLIYQNAALLSLASNEPTIISKLAAAKISLADLTAASSLSGSDLLLIRQGTQEKSVTQALLTPDASETVKGIIELATLAEVQAGVDAVRAVTPATLAASLLTPGTIVYVAKNTAPNGFLKANGAAISRTAYAALFAALGTAFGAGDGATTFSLPDLRGEFVRGWDDGRGVDSGRALGSSQSWAIQNITGRANSDLVRFNLGATDGAFAVESMVSRSRPSTTTTGDTYGINFDASRVVNTASETRPRNVALLACIKY